MQGGLNWQEKRDREKEFLDTDQYLAVQIKARNVGLV
jgi:hypothetical protein